VLTAAPAGATTLLRLDDDQLVDQSSHVVTGTCDTVRTEWRSGMLVRLATIRIDGVLKGEAVSEVTVVMPGGVDLDREVPVAVIVPGTPTLARGERVLLFLEPAAFGFGIGNLTTPLGATPELAVTGFSQGKFSIFEGADGKPMVRRDLAGVALLEGNRPSAGGARTVPLDLFEERVRRRARLAPAAPPADPRDR
jgi:hypothetical protein